MFHLKKIILGVTVEITITSHKKKRTDDIFIRYLTSKISEMEQNTHLYKGKNYAGNSISNYRKILKLWPDFEKFAGLPDIRISDITMDIYSRFMEFCDSRHYMESTKYMYAALIKSVMNCALEDGISKNNIQNSKSFVTHRVSSIFKKVYLTREEISRLASLELKRNSALEKVRDVFLVGCLTGQRFSDYSKISMDEMEVINVDGKEYKAFRMVQKKTEKTIIVPILDRKLPAIIEKWGGKLPKISISFMNSQIKELCRMAGIDSPTTIYIRKGGERLKVIKPKYELISSHTARRSCITNLYLDGKLTSGQIRSISGHANEESFKRYLCQNYEEEIKGIIRKITDGVHGSFSWQQLRFLRRILR